MRLEAALQGNLEKYLQTEVRNAETAMMRGMKEATDGLKNEMRQQTLSAGLGNRLAKSWRGITYPKRVLSLNPTGHVFSRATRILYGFETGDTIRAKGGRFLAIPTENAPKRARGKKITPRSYERVRGVKLQFVHNLNGASFLVDNQAVATYSRKTGELKGFRKASKSALRTGKGLSSIIVFWLVPSVKKQKKLSFARTSAKWQSKIPDLAVKNWKG